MKRNKKHIVLVAGPSKFYVNFLPAVFLLLPLVMCAQQLTLDSAIAISLKNNYNIILARNTYREAENKYTPGMAGMLPNISANATYSISATAINQKFVSGLQINESGVASNTISPFLALNWTLFDGMRMFAAYDQLRLMKDEGMENLKGAMQNNIASVIEAYYDIVMQKQLLEVNDSNLALYNEEKDIAEQQYKVGMGSKLNFLQAEVSCNAQSSAYLRQQVALANSIIALNQILELPLQTTYTVPDDIEMGGELKLDSLNAIAAAQNPTLLLAKTAIDVAHTNVREANALLSPTLSLGMQYGLSRSQWNAGFFLLNESSGLLGGGLTLSWTLFNGSTVHVQRENAQLDELNANLQYKLATVTVNASLLQNFKQYEINLRILRLDEDNFKVAKENVSVALEQFKVGTTNIVQLQQAQASFTLAGSQVVTDRYNAKVSETQLLQLAGQLAK